MTIEREQTEPRYKFEENAMVWYAGSSEPIGTFRIYKQFGSYFAQNRTDKNVLGSVFRMGTGDFVCASPDQAARLGYEPGNLF